MGCASRPPGGSTVDAVLVDCVLDDEALFPAVLEEIEFTIVLEDWVGTDDATVEDVVVDSCGSIVSDVAVLVIGVGLCDFTVTGSWLIVALN